MKNKIIRIMGVLATVATIMSLFVAQSAPAAAAAQSWTKLLTPANAGIADSSVLWNGPLERAINGDIYKASGHFDNDGNQFDDGVFIFRSTDFGRTWTMTGQPTYKYFIDGTYDPDGSGPIAGGALAEPFGLASGIIGQRSDPSAPFLDYPVITDIACSSANANIVYVTDGYDIFKSVDAGSTWVALTNLFVTQNLISGDFNVGLFNMGFIVSIDIGYFGGGAYVFAACTTFGNTDGDTDNVGGAYVLQESVYLQPWADMKVGLDRHEALSDSIDVTEIKVMPDFSTTQGVMAVVTDYDYDFEDIRSFASLGNGTAVLVTTKYGPAQWSMTANDVILTYTDEQDYFPVQSMLLDATIWFPSDFSSNPYGMNMDCLVGINPEDITQGDVHLCYFGPPSQFDEPSLSYDLNIRGADTSTCISDLDGMGPVASFSVIASGYFEDSDIDDINFCLRPTTFTTRNGGITWAQAAKLPTGGASPLIGPDGQYGDELGRPLSSLRVKGDFLTSGKALIATHGIDCAVSYTGDYGVVWNGISQISTLILEKHDLFVCNDGTIYMSTDFELPISDLDKSTLTLSANKTTSATTTTLSTDATVLTKNNSTGVLLANITVTGGVVGIQVFPGVITLADGTGVHDTTVPAGPPAGDLALGANTIKVTTLGTFTLTLPANVSGIAQSGDAVVTGSPLALPAGGTTTITTTHTGNFTITLSSSSTTNVIVNPAGTSAIVSLDNSGDFVVFRALVDNTQFQLDLDNPLLGSYSYGVEQDDPGLGVSAGIYNHGTHQVIWSGSFDDVVTTNLPDTTKAVPNVAAVYETSPIDLIVQLGAVAVTIGTTTTTYNAGPTEIEFVLDGTNTTATIVSVGNNISQVLLRQDSATGAKYAVAGPFGVGSTVIPVEGNSVTLTLQGTLFEALPFYSLWRLAPGAIRTSQSGVTYPDWERVNSWSLYTCPDSPTTFVDWDTVRGTADCAAIFLVDQFTHYLYRSVDKGQTWLRQPQYIPFDSPGELVMSVVVVSPTTIIAGGMNGEIWYSNNLGLWIRRNVFPTNTWVTDLQVGTNGDLVAIGIAQQATTSSGATVTLGSILLNRSVAATTNVAFAVWGGILDTTKDNLVGGGVKQILILNSGSGFTSTPTVNITSADGNGSGAVATASRSSTTQKLTSVTVTNPGSGYDTAPIVTITGGGGSGAVVLAVFDPHMARLALSSDYATSGYVNFGGDAGITAATIATTDFTGVSFTGGVWRTTFPGSSSGPTRMDNDGEWSVVGVNATDPAGISGIRSAAGGPGFTEEGLGMVYAVSSFVTSPEINVTSITNGVLRFKGRSTGTSRGELINKPTGVNLDQLWIGPTDVGNTTLYSFGDDCNIYTYTDTINKAVTGLKATATTNALQCATCPLYGSTLTITWDAMANATHYFVVIDDTTAWTSVYGANEASEQHNAIGSTIILPATDLARVVTTNSLTTSVDWTGAPLKTDQKYNISVWALKYTGSATTTYVQEDAKPEILERRFLTSFGMGTSVATPPAPVANLMPAAAANNIPIRPTFQWNAVPNAINYTLQVSTVSDFSTMVAPTPVTVTGTAYAWPTTATPLAYNTDYYWRVMATTANGNGPWMTNVFTTVMQPVSPLPAVTINIPTQVITLQAPPVTVNIPAQPTPTVILPSIVFPAQPTPIINLPAPIVNIPVQTTPVYIWIIVAVGAILTIAVIVLIIRTRRVV